MPINFNINPYYDDHNPDKEFLRILFRPGYAVQARELTQLQTILQKQIGQFGEGVYKNGSTVFGALTSVNDVAKYIVLESTFGGVDITEAVLATMKGKFIVTNQNGNLPITGFESSRYFVQDYRPATDTTPPLLFATLVSGTGTVGSEWIYLETDSNQTNLAQVSSAVGNLREGEATLVSIDEGVFYVNEFFVHTPAQTLVISSEYDNNHPATCRVGLDIEHVIVDEDDDTTLLDPAEGSYNYTAPGGHRYTINLNLVRKDTYDPTAENADPIAGTSDIDFIELMRFSDGGLDKAIKYPIFSALGDELARTIYDIHGNFVVEPFTLDILPHKQNPPDDTKLSIEIGAGRAYVHGRLFETPQPVYKELDKAREFDVAESNNIGVEFGNYVITHQHRSVFDIDNQETVDLLDLQSNLTDDYTQWINITDYDTLTAVSTATEPVVGNKIRVTFTGGNRWAVINGIWKDTANNGVWYRLTDTSSVNNDDDLVTPDTWPADQTDRAVSIFSTDGEEELFNFSTDTNTQFVGTSIPENLYNLMKIGTAQVRMIRFSERDVTNGSVDIKNRTYLYEIKVQKGSFDNLETLAVSTLAGGVYTFDRSARIAPDGKFNEEENNATILFEPSFNTLIFELPYENIRSIKSGGLLPSEGGLNDIDYAYQTLYTNITIPNAGSGGVQSSGIISADGNNLFYPSAGAISSTVAQLFYTITLRSGSFTDNNGFAYTAGDIVDLGPTSGVTLAIDLGRPDDSADTLRVTFPETGDGPSGLAVAPSVGTTFDIITSINVNNGAEKAKSTAIKTLTYEDVDFSSNQTRSLYTSDVYEIVGAWDSGDPENGIAVENFTIDADGNLINPADDTLEFENIAERFELSDGQKDNFYDYASIKFNTGNAELTGRLVIRFRYFQHITSGATGVFTVNSNTDVDYEDIPQFSSTTTGQLFELRNVLDFRGRRRDAVIADNVVDTAGNNVTSFTDLEGTILPLPTTTVETDFSYYLSRRDRLVLSEDESFRLVKGVSSLRPDYPVEPEGSMTLFLIDIPAYTFEEEDVTFEYIPQKNYTAREVADIEVRLNDLEYLTVLNALESEAESLTITNPDGSLGLKTGILVDGFNGHDVGDVSNPDHDCSIDFEEGELRPPFEEEQSSLEMDEDSSNDVQRTGELITLPYSNEVLVDIPLCSKAINVNPYNVTSFLGTMELSPHMDNWIEIEQRPTVNVNLRGENDAHRALVFGINRRIRRRRRHWNRRFIGGGVQWNNWNTTWSGTSTNTSSRVSTSTSRSGNFIVRKRQRVTRQTTVLTRQQTRTGIRTRWGMKTVKKSLGNKVVDLTIIPWMRAKEVFFLAKGMKPNTTVFPWFDDVNVAQYCRPANRVDIVGNSLTFSPDAEVFETRFLEKEELEVYDVDDPNNVLGRGAIVAGHDGATGSLIMANLSSENSFSTKIVKRTQRTSATVSDKWSEAVGRRHRRRIIRTYNISDILGNDENGRQIVAKTLQCTGIQVRGDLNASSEYIVVRFANNRRRWWRRWWRRRWWWRWSTNRFLAGRFSGVRADSKFRLDSNFVSRNVTPGLYTINGKQYLRIWINPTGRVNYSPRGMSNFYDIKFQFSATYDLEKTVEDVIQVENPGTQEEINNLIAENSRVLELRGTQTTFTNADGQTVTRTPPTARIAGLVTTQEGDSLVTDQAGRIAGIFNLPNEGEGGTRFKTGERVFRILDDPNKSDPVDSTTSADATYTASGQKKVMQNTTVTTRVPGLIRETVTQTRTVRSVVRRTTSRRTLSTSRRRIRWSDPVAETILVDHTKYPNGVYITKLDLFFRSKDPSLPVQVQIRPTQNGYPDSAVVIPFADIEVPPNDVILPENPFDNESVLAAPTEIRFNSPVYLQPGEYAVVVLSNSNNYEVYVSEMGKEILGSSNRITEQPYAGSLFKSQNASTWTAYQGEDLMFRLYKAVFDTSVVGEAILGQFEMDELAPWQVFKSLVETIDPGDATTLEYYWKGTTQSRAEDEQLEPEQAIDTEWREYTPGENVFANREMAAGPEAGTFYLKYNLSSTDSNVSPAVDIEPGRILFIDQNINNGDIESEDIIMNTIGKGYDPADPPSTENGRIVITGIGGGVSAIANVSDGTDDIHESGDLIGIRVLNQGSGFFETPTITVDASNPGEIAPLMEIFGETNAEGGNALARYVTRQVTLPDDRVASDNLSVRMRCYRPRGSFIEVYAKVLSASDDSAFDDTKYVRLDLQQTNTFSESVGETVDLEWRPVGGAIKYTNADGTEFNNFVTFAIKVCLFTDSKARVPYCQDLRVVAGST